MKCWQHWEIWLLTKLTAVMEFLPDCWSALQIAPSLCALFSKSLSSSILPDDWKLDNAFPVHKRVEKSYAENYRPISLLWLISKVFELCVFERIPTNQPFSARIYHRKIVCNATYWSTWTVMMHIGHSAFDKVNHTKLATSTTWFRFGESILNWFSLYLCNRRQQHQNR